MKTGSFRNCANLRGAVSISSGVPDFFHGPQYRKVAPRWNMLKMSREDYDYEFGLILEKLDPEEVYRDLMRLGGGSEPILLCWEKPNTWCHRRRIAEWLENSLIDVEITEHGFSRDQVLPYNAPPQEPEPIILAPSGPKQLELF